jgi:hypothetical protein
VVVVVVRSPLLVGLFFGLAVLPLEPCVAVEVLVLVLALANFANAGADIPRASATAAVATMSFFIWSTPCF